MRQSGQVSFEAHVDLLTSFLSRRHDIVERIQGLLGAQRQPPEYLQDTASLSRRFESVFFSSTDAAAGLTRLRGQLEDAHWSAGFKPRHIPGLHNGLIDPGEMMGRGFHLWQQTRWPGRNGRLRYAETLFNVYLVRCLALLSMRIWDAGRDAAAGRLAEVQRLLDQLWRGTPSDQPPLVRDARWLIQLAQSPATDDLGAYFRIAEQITEGLDPDRRIEIHKAGARMAAGHLRSQIRYHSLNKAVALDDPGVVLATRTSNALDFALLIQDLVPLLEAYERACQGEDVAGRLDLADAICQGMSPDPELFLNRPDLLGAYSMIEHLFVETDGEGRAHYSPMGARHVGLIGAYTALAGRLAKPLHDDCPHFRPIAGTYSPYGALYGFSTNLMEHMVLRTLQPEAGTEFSLEDVFVSGANEGKLAWVTGWRKLPHLKREIEARFDYPQQFAEDIFSRLERALARQTQEAGTPANGRTGRLHVRSQSAPPFQESVPSELPLQYVTSTDDQLVAAAKAHQATTSQLLSDRVEGKFVVSYQTAGGWTAIDKSMLTEVLGAGRDAAVVLPAAPAEVMTLMCPGLVRHG